MNNESIKPFNLFQESGVLYIKDGKAKDGHRPLYYIELVRDDSEDDPDSALLGKVVMAYTPKVLNGKITKSYSIETVEYNNFTGTSQLSDLAKKAFTKEHKRIVYDLPLFSAPIEMGEDTFTKEYGPGFEECERMTVTKSKSLYCKPTGVFISLSSIVWNEPKIVTNALRDYVKPQQGGPDSIIWF